MGGLFCVIVCAMILGAETGLITYSKEWSGDSTSNEGSCTRRERELEVREKMAVY